MIAAYQSGLFNADDMDILECRHEVVRRVGQVQDGNNAHVVGLLLAQALALNSIFTRLAVKASEVDELDGSRQMETYLRLSLKAQAQSRATLEAVLAVGNPPVLFANQANVAFGPQQVNIGVAPTGTVAVAAHETAHSGNQELAPNEVLEMTDGKRVEPGAAGPTGRSDSSMVPMETVNRTAERHGQGQVVDERQQGRNSKTRARIDSNTPSRSE